MHTRERETQFGFGPAGSICTAEQWHSNQLTKLTNEDPPSTHNPNPPLTLKACQSTSPAWVCMVAVVVLLGMWGHTHGEIHLKSRSRFYLWIGGHAWTSEAQSSLFPSIRLVAFQIHTNYSTGAGPPPLSSSAFSIPLSSFVHVSITS